MKYCIKCTAPLNDNDKFCNVCGTEQTLQRTVINRFCTNCGTQINNVEVCPVCGKLVTNTQSQELLKRVTPTLISTLMNRIMMSAILWFINAGLQLLVAFILLCIAAYTSHWNSTVIRAIFIYGTLGGLNIWVTILNLKTRNSISINYVGIVENIRIRFRTIIILLWNIYIVFKLLFSNSILLTVIALPIIAALIMDLFFIKLFVIRNKDRFLELEKSQIPDAFCKNCGAIVKMGSTCCPHCKTISENDNISYGNTKQNTSYSNTNPFTNQNDPHETKHKGRKIILIVTLTSIVVLLCILYTYL